MTRVRVLVIHAIVGILQYASVAVSVAAQAVPAGRATKLEIAGPVAQLSTVRAIALVGDMLLVSQPTDNAILLVRRGGSVVRSIGRAGGGPGEFRSLTTIGALADTLWVYDGQQRRLTLFSLSGNLLRTQSVQDTVPDDFGGPNVIGYLGGGLRLIGYTRNDPRAAGRDWAVRVVPIGGPGRLLGLMRLSKGVVRLPRGGMMASGEYQRYFGDGTIVRLARDRIVVVDRAREDGGVTVRGYGFDGEEVSARKYALPAIRVNDSVATAIRRGLAGAIARMGGSAADAERLVREYAPIPTHYPYATNALVAPDGTVVIQAMTADIARLVWRALTPAGSVRTLFTTPSNFIGYAFDGHAIWGVEVDADGAQSIVAYSAERS